VTTTTNQTPWERASLERTPFDQTSLRDTIAMLRSGGDESILASARGISPELASRAAENDRLGVYPEESIALFWSTGLGALTIPAENGGLGASLTTTARTIEILAQSDAAATLVVVWTLLFHRLINAPGSLWPKHLVDLVTSDALAGPSLSNFLNVEPQLGSSVRGGVVATNATQVTLADGSPGWRINGHKIYSTGGKGLRWCVVSAAVGSQESGDLQLGSFLVSGEDPGVEVIETWDQLGMRATASNDIVFRDVDVPFDHAIGLKPSTSQPVRVPEDDPNGTRAATSLLLMAVYNGVAKASRDFLITYLNDRKPTNLGAPLSSLPRFQIAVGEIEALIYDNDRLIFDFTKSFDERQKKPNSYRDTSASIQRESSLIKLLVSRNVIKSTELALSLVGNPGLSRHNPLERHYRDALCSRVHTPQDDFVLLEAGKFSLGLGGASSLISKEAKSTAATTTAAPEIIDEALGR
jgi:alkylation response protein AidB-like acyl-CoA dehydrogenase